MRTIPTPRNCALLAGRFGLSYPDLQVRFGLMSRQDVWNYGINAIYRSDN